MSGIGSNIVGHIHLEGSAQYNNICFPGSGFQVWQWCVLVAGAPELGLGKPSGIGEVGATVLVVQSAWELHKEGNSLSFLPKLLGVRGSELCEVSIAVLVFLQWTYDS